MQGAWISVNLNQRRPKVQVQFWYVVHGHLIEKYKNAHMNIANDKYCFCLFVARMEGFGKSQPIWSAKVKINNIVGNKQKKSTTLWSGILQLAAVPSKYRLFQVLSSMYAYHAMYESFIFAVISQLAWLPAFIKRQKILYLGTQISGSTTGHAPAGRGHHSEKYLKFKTSFITFYFSFDHSFFHSTFSFVLSNR